MIAMLRSSGSGVEESVPVALDMWRTADAWLRATEGVRRVRPVVAKRRTTDRGSDAALAAAAVASARRGRALAARLTATAADAAVAECPRCSAAVAAPAGCVSARVCRNMAAAMRCGG